MMLCLDFIKRTAKQNIFIQETLSNNNKLNDKLFNYKYFKQYLKKYEL